MCQTQGHLHNQGEQRRMILVVNFFLNFEIDFLCLVFAICDLVHDVEAIFHFPYMLTASGKLF